MLNVDNSPIIIFKTRITGEITEKALSWAAGLHSVYNAVAGVVMRRVVESGVDVIQKDPQVSGLCVTS